MSDGVTRVKEEVLILDRDIKRLMGEDFLKRLRTNKKIDALPEIIIGKMPIGGVGNKDKKTTSGASQSGGNTSKSDESGDHRAIGT